MTYQAIEDQTRISCVIGENIYKTSFSQRNIDVLDWKENQNCSQMFFPKNIKKCKHILKDHKIEKKKLS